VWTGTVSLTNISDRISVKFTDRFNRTLYDSITLNYYGNPDILINYPVISGSEIDTMVSQIEIRGTVLRANSGDSVFIYSGNTLKNIVSLTSPNSLFSGTVSLTNQTDSVFAVLKNKLDAYDTDFIVVNYLSDLSVKITYPADYTDTNISDVTVSGTSYNSQMNDIVEVFVNGIYNSKCLIQNLNGVWSGTSKINSQNDRITVKITDKFNRISYDTITINNFGVASVKILSPVSEYDTLSKNVSVSGTTYNTVQGDTVWIFVNQIYQDSITLGVNGSWSGNIQLTGISDVITARVYPKFSLSSEDTIVLNYLNNPVIKIISPENNFDTLNQIILISGTSSDINGPDTIEFFVNQQLKSILNLNALNSDWSGTVQLSGYYDNLTVKLTDQFGRYCFDSVVVSFINEPKVEITYPHNEFYETMVHSITVSGTTWFTKSGDTISVYVNGIYSNSNLITDDSGTWSIGDIVISGINDRINVKLTDKFGRVCFDTVYVNYYGQPFVKITYPSSYSHDTMINVMTVSGTTLNTGNNDTVELFVNNIKLSNFNITSLNENFSGTVLLSGISDKLVSKITDRFGRTVYDTITINYFSEPFVKILFPVNNFDTVSSIITVSGTTLHSQINDTVKIYCNNTFNSQINLQNVHGNFSGTAKLSGLNDSVTVIFTDQFNREKTDTVIINYIGDLLAVLNYPVNKDTYVNNIIVSGTTLGTVFGDTIELFINNNLNYRHVIDNYNASWSGSVNISNIGDSLLIKLYTGFGRVYYDTLTLNHFDAPSLKITIPANNSETSITTITVLGTTAKSHINDTVKLYVNSVFQSGVTLAASNSQWSGTAKLSSSYDSIVAEFTDRFNRKFYDTISINYLMYAPKIQVLNPLNNVETSVKVIYVSGTSAYTLKNDKIYIYVNNIIQSSKTLTENNGLWSGTASITDINDTLTVKVENVAGRIDIHNLTASFIEVDSNNSYLSIQNGINTAGDTGIYKIHFQSKTGKNLSARSYLINSDLSSGTGYFKYSGITDNFGDDTIYFYNTKSGTINVTSVLSLIQSGITSKIYSKPSVPSVMNSYFSGENQGFGDGSDITDVEFNIIDSYGNAVPDRIVQFNVSGETGNISVVYSNNISDKNGKIYFGLKSSAPCSVILSVKDITAVNFDYSNTQSVLFKEGLPAKIYNVGNKNLNPGDSNVLILDFEVSTSFDNDILNKIIVTADNS
ncbi:hypothetical protein KA977_13440, partial [Candidatus Dependentiae bacterium]|nr:hypothetical protein [Candidatus Dependentiae bacterium]